MKNIKLYCRYAFKGLAITNQGQLKPCCIFNNKYAPLIYLKDGIEKYKDSQWLKEFQQNFIDGKKHPGCELCWNLEEGNLPSRRQQIEQQDYTFSEDDNSGFEVLTLPFGNTCNLACRICGPHNSSRWISLMKQFDEHTDYRVHNWISNDEFVKDIYDHTQGIVSVEFPGGEPLLADVEKHFNLLKLWIDSGQAENITIQYTTNMTLSPKDEWWKIWSKFKNVSIMGSCDDIEDRFEYNRYPAKWSTVYENIKMYKEKIKEYSNVNFQLNCTISLFTFLRANNIFKFGLQNGFKIIFNFLRSPLHYNPGVLYPHFKDILKDVEHTYLIEKITNTYQTDYSNLLPITKKEIEKIDLQRNQNFKNTFPELVKYLY